MTPAGGMKLSGAGDCRAGTGAEMRGGCPGCSAGRRSALHLARHPVAALQALQRAPRVQHAERAAALAGLRRGRPVGGAGRELSGASLGRWKRKATPPPPPPPPPPPSPENGGAAAAPRGANNPHGNAKHLGNGAQTCALRHHARCGTALRLAEKASVSMRGLPALSTDATSSRFPAAAHVRPSPTSAPARIGRRWGTTDTTRAAWCVRGSPCR